MNMLYVMFQNKVQVPFGLVSISVPCRKTIKTMELFKHYFVYSVGTIFDTTFSGDYGAWSADQESFDHTKMMG